MLYWTQMIFICGKQKIELNSINKWCNKDGRQDMRLKINK